MSRSELFCSAIFSLTTHHQDRPHHLGIAPRMRNMENVHTKGLPLCCITALRLASALDRAPASPSSTSSGAAGPSLSSTLQTCVCACMYVYACMYVCGLNNNTIEECFIPTYPNMIHILCMHYYDSCLVNALTAIVQNICSSFWKLKQ